MEKAKASLSGPLRTEFRVVCNEGFKGTSGREFMRVSARLKSD